MVAQEAEAVGWWPELGLRVVGSRRVLRHFEAEYGPSESGDGRPVGVIVSFGSEGEGFEPVGSLTGRRKTTMWRVRLGPPSNEPLQAHIAVRGPFGLPLLQSIVVEPLVGVALARRGQVLLPAAGIVQGETVLLILGAPGAGKSSLGVRAHVRGMTLIGDDHVMIDGTGLCRPFPRRFRLYPDLPSTSPVAFGRLPTGARLGLRLRELGRVVTRGAVRLPILVEPSALGVVSPPRSRPVGRVVILGRSADLSEPQIVTRQARELAADAVRLLIADRAALARSGPAWETVSIDASALEQRVLESAWASVPGEVIRVPASWSAPRALDYLEGALGVAR